MNTTSIAMLSISVFSFVLLLTLFLLRVRMQARMQGAGEKETTEDQRIFSKPSSAAEQGLGATDSAVEEDRGRSRGASIA